MIKLKAWVYSGNAWTATDAGEVGNKDEGYLFAKALIDYVYVSVDDMAVELIDTETGRTEGIIFGESGERGIVMTRDLFDQVIEEDHQRAYARMMEGSK